jgi:phosphatidate cytidylyltransferase
VVTLGLPLVALASGRTENLQARVAHRVWWLMAAGWSLSHAPALLRLDLPSFAGREVLLVVWLVIVVQGSDVLPYVVGKLYGRRSIAPTLSPDKTVEGFAGGIVAASAIGAALWWMTPFGAWASGALAVLLTLLGFAGGLVLSAVKRDLGIKDWGRAIKGHGGVLDRVDSLVLSAPALFYLTRAFAG